MREKPTTLAKLTRPKLFAAVPRARLFQLLDDRLAHRIAWVTGPPGAGKTTLASGYVESREKRALWYHLDSGDADIATFFYYLGVAAQGLAGRRHAQVLPGLTPEYLPDLLGFTRRFFRELFARLPRPSLIVLDDYHEVPSGSALHGVIACALSELPEGVACVVTSRTDPPPECARLSANQAIVTIDWKALRLTEQETAAIALSRQVIDEWVIRASHDRSDGWVAGLILLLGQPQVTQVASAPKLAPSSTSLFKYFADIFANRLPAETREVLLDTAFLQSVTGPIAVRLSGNEHAERLIQKLNEDNYFVNRSEGTEPIYQLHALFRDFLISLVRQRTTQDERLEKVRKAADTLVEFGDSEQAAVLYGEAGDWGRAIDIVLVLAPRLLMQGRWQTLQARIAAFPQEAVAERPWLQYWLGASQMAVDPRAANATVVSAYEGFARTQDAVGQMLAAATAIEIQFVLWNDFTGIGRWIEVLEPLIEKEAPHTSPEMEIRVLTNMVQALTCHAPWHPQLNKYAQRLLELARSDVAASQRVLAAAVLSHHFGWLGNIESSLQASAIARPLLTRKDIPPVQKVWVLMALAYASYTRADHDEGGALFARAFAICEEHGLSFMRFWIDAADCWRRLDRGEYKAVASVIGKLEAAPATGRGLDVGHLHVVKSWLALLEGNFALARQEMETARALTIQTEVNYLDSYQMLMLAEILIEQQDYSQAEKLVARFRARFASIGSPVFEFNALLVNAYRALRQRDDVRCAAALRKAFGLGRTNGYVTTLNWYGRMMSRLCGFALENDIEVEYATMLIVRRGLSPDAPLERWPWPVRIYTLGRFEISINGDALRFEGKAQRKPVALAKVLVGLGGRDVPADKVIDILWPEPSEGDGRKALDITVHRLRKLLGSDEAVEVTDRHVALNPQVVWVDAWAMDRTLSPLIAAVNAPEPEIGLLEAAASQVLNLYRGHFLAGDAEESWQIPIRNRLAGRFQRFALRLGASWESQKNWRRALELYRRAVEIDPLAEVFYRREMICLQAQGQRAEAIEVFRRCRQVLSVTLGVPPTGETEAVYKQLLAS